MAQGVQAAFLYSDRFSGYAFNPEHPLKPQRLRLVHDLLQAYQVFNRPEVCAAEAHPAAAAEVLAVHTRDYYDTVAALSADPRAGWASTHGFDSPDNPPFRGMLEASLLYTGASLQAARLVSAGKVPRAFNISGGLHHAMPDRASGFCIFNDPAITIADLLKRHARVLYVDIDAHHGDGVQAAFYDSPRVLTLSLHESGQYLFPGTGFPREIGEGAGTGYSVNIPLLPGTGDETYLRVFDALVPPLVQWFAPEVVIAQLGIDTHYRDPLTHLALTTRGFSEAVRRIRDWGHPLVALGGGGYAVEVVARAWSIAFALLAGIDLPAALPGKYLETYGGQPDKKDTLHDPPGEVIPAADRTAVEEYADRTIEEVHRLIFNRHGIPVSRHASVNSSP